ncbi:NAD-dependent epimerase/dehydratase family protein [Salinisphaera orenii]|uniref:NAD-dependent epimerase/dehydratase family protein n=1 Tax=Salinisphaera orenii TaxID=856731 RepID=UPI000DBE8803
MNVKHLAVTGASGFIGGALVAALVRSGYVVKALTRRDDAASKLRAHGAEVVRGGLGDREAVAELVDSVDAVLHCAGTTTGARYGDFEQTNVAGTCTLVESLAGSSVPVLALSSLAATRPELSYYAQSKAAMEHVLEADTSRTCVMLRPPPVYGPGDRQLAPLFAALAWGIAPMPVAPESRISLLYVDDLVSAIVAWLDGGAEVSGTYPLHDGTPNGYSWDEIVDTVARARGAPVRRLRVPPGLLSGGARVNQWLARALGYSPMLTPGKLRELRYPDWVCDNAAWCSAVNWRPTVDLAAGFGRLRGQDNHSESST